MTQKNYFTPAELAELKLPGLPKSKRAIAIRIDDENWATRTDAKGSPLARRRAGRGGGTEYHLSLLPESARVELERRGVVAKVSEQDATHTGELWRWHDGQSASVKAEAERRSGIVGTVMLLEQAGTSRSAAVAEAAVRHGVASSTLWGWLNLIDGVESSNWLPALSPRRRGGGVEAEVDGDLWQILLSDYLRLSKPSWQACFRRTEAAAQAAGKTLPHVRTLWRKFVREVPAQVVVLRRKGKEALRRSLPAQIRSVADLHAMELVNIDGHTCDVFVNWGKDAKGRDIIARPTLIAIQDVYSRKFLSWRFARSEDMVTARLVFADLFREHGIPGGLLSDNGRAFASKWLTGGAKTRFRFKVRDEDPQGVLTALGITIHWAKPYRGQSKPIERGFRDFCDAIAKHPAFEGAYTGNSPVAKPENYGNAAVPLEMFKAVWNAGIAAHNAQLGRRSEMGGGTRSFDQVFADSYARSAIGKATPEQLRIALCAADQLTCNRQNGAITLAGNRYWSPDMLDLAGQKVMVRFDPDDLMQPLHVYSRDGKFLLSAPVWEADGFLDMAAAKQRQRLEKDWKKAAKQAVDALDLLSADQLVAALPKYDDEAAEPLRPAATRIVHHRGQTAAALKVAEEPLNDDLEASEQHLKPQKEAGIDRIGRAMLRLVEKED